MKKKEPIPMLQKKELLRVIRKVTNEMVLQLPLILKLTIRIISWFEANDLPPFFSKFLR